MKIEVRKLSETSAELKIAATNPSMVNILRRVLIADIPKMALEDVEFHLGSIRDEDGREYESLTPLFDEIVSHRLGLIPIPTDLSLFGFKKDCECEGDGCPNCTIMYTLNKKGPCTVYSGDLEPLGGPEFSIKEDKIPIVRLSENQALLVYATAILGIGSEHAKWQVAHGVGFKFMPKIEIKPRLMVGKDREEKCNFCNSCLEVLEASPTDAKKEEPIKISSDDSVILFHFDTDGALSATDALLETVKIVESKFSDFQDGLKSIKSSMKGKEK